MKKLCLMLLYISIVEYSHVSIVVIVMCLNNELDENVT